MASDDETNGGAQTERAGGVRDSGLLPQCRTALSRSGSQTARESRSTTATSETKNVALDLWNMHVRAVALHQSDEHRLAEELYQTVILEAKKHASGDGMRQLLFKAMNNLALLYEDIRDFEKVGHLRGGGIEQVGHVRVLAWLPSIRAR